MAILKIGDRSTPVSDFFRGSTVLITGGTGFVGKVLVEKLLRCFAVKRIYLLVRDKKGVSAKDRLSAYFEESIFDKIREESPEVFEKVRAVNTDYDADDLGLSSSDRLLITEEVEIVFNVVASVKFNEELRAAIAINVLGTSKVMDLVIQMKKLKSFLHISTFFSNCNRRFIAEEVYDSEFGWEQVFQLKNMNNALLEAIKPTIVGTFPNTYILTKNCAENLVNSKSKGLPVGIFRLPIVLPTYKEPLPGWSDNIYGPGSIVVSSSMGLMHSFYLKPEKTSNVIPADFCVNAMIACAHDTAIGRPTESQPKLKVYNFNFHENNLTWGQFFSMSAAGFHEPFPDIFWCYSFRLIPSKVLYKICVFFWQRLPAYFLDFLLMLAGKKQRFSKINSKIEYFAGVVEYFGIRDWQFDNDNVLQVERNLTPAEQELLQFNLKTVNWKEYFGTYLSGIRKYYFKDTASTTVLAKRRRTYKIFLALHWVIKTSFWAALGMGAWKFARLIFI